MSEFLEVESEIDRAEAVYVPERGDEATEEHPARRSRQTVAKCAHHSSIGPSSSHKRARREPKAEAPPRETPGPEAGLEPIFSAGEYTEGEEEDSSANLRPRSRHTKGPMVTGVEETFLVEESERPTGDRGLRLLHLNRKIFLPSLKLPPLHH